ncbi:MAG: hypothetical protein ACI4AE_00845 [Candidatus Cryptobacteroides sp.]
MEPVRIFLDTNIVLDYYTGRMGDTNAKTIVASGQEPSQPSAPDRSRRLRI